MSGKEAREQQFVFGGFEWRHVGFIAGRCGRPNTNLGCCATRRNVSREHLPQILATSMIEELAVAFAPLRIKDVFFQAAGRSPLGIAKACPKAAQRTGLLSRRERPCWRSWRPRRHRANGQSASPQWRGLWVVGAPRMRCGCSTGGPPKGQISFC